MISKVFRILLTLYINSSPKTRHIQVLRLSVMSIVTLICLHTQFLSVEYFPQEMLYRSCAIVRIKPRIVRRPLPLLCDSLTVRTFARIDNGKKS